LCIALWRFVLVCIDVEEVGVDVLNEGGLSPFGAFAVEGAAFGVGEVEVLAGALLIIGWWRQTAALVIAAMNVLFLAAVSLALARGLEVCGCFGAAVARKASAWTLVEDAALLAAAIWVCQTKGDNDETNRGGN